MSAGIVPGIDAGIMGYCDVFGSTWHGFPEYAEQDGPVSMDETRLLLEHTVNKVPLQLGGEKFLGNATPMFALVRDDDGRQVYNESVSDEYYITQNSTFLDQLQTRIIDPNPQVVIESTGTLFAFRVGFVNLLLNKFVVEGDSSETINRLMYYNAFGGRSITAGAHTTRIECANTMGVAEAQSYANGTVRKFKHTKNAELRLAEHLVDLNELSQIMEGHKAALDWLAGIKMNGSDVENFVSQMFKIPIDPTSTMKTRRERERAKLLAQFEDAVDLQGKIARTRYSMLQAVTWYAANEMQRGDSDAAFAYFNVISGGNRDIFNQKGFRALMEEDLGASRIAATATA
jgi:hypothetical protein